jgi:hypothetical protein
MRLRLVSVAGTVACALFTSSPAAAQIMVNMTGRITEQISSQVPVDPTFPLWGVGTTITFHGDVPQENVVYYPGGLTAAFGGRDTTGGLNNWPSDSYFNWLPVEQFFISAPGTIFAPYQSNTGGGAYTRPGFEPTDSHSDEGFNAPIWLHGHQIVGVDFNFYPYEDLNLAFQSYSGNQFHMRSQWGEFVGEWDFAGAEISGAGLVPEPSTWVLAILGFGLVGAAIRLQASARISRRHPHAATA